MVLKASTEEEWGDSPWAGWGWEFGGLAATQWRSEDLVKGGGGLSINDEYTSKSSSLSLSYWVPAFLASASVLLLLLSLAPFNRPFDTRILYKVARTNLLSYSRLTDPLKVASILLSFFV
ncbi:hypothetical protein QJS10_CPA10g01364 [Acorus calamus]|uniref:Uncharacterized protein n=1 Tax=Acorus calamus TaxID=4465 RepID=A0AAV9DWF7_ACOCL|nr:hypothetical protein QJS10_CPA10g01364 [Acorus calamus]